MAKSYRQLISSAYVNNGVYEFRVQCTSQGGGAMQGPLAQVSEGGTVATSDQVSLAALSSQTDDDGNPLFQNASGPDADAGKNLDLDALIASHPGAATPPG